MHINRENKHIEQVSTNKNPLGGPEMKEIKDGVLTWKHTSEGSLDLRKYGAWFYCLLFIAVTAYAIILRWNSGQGFTNWTALLFIVLFALTMRYGRGIKRFKTDIERAHLMLKVLILGAIAIFMLAYFTFHVGGKFVAYTDNDYVVQCEEQGHWVDVRYLNIEAFDDEVDVSIDFNGDRLDMELPVTATGRQLHKRWTDNTSFVSGIKKETQDTKARVIEQYPDMSTDFLFGAFLFKAPKDIGVRWVADMELN